MKIIVFGATGRVGSEFSKKAIAAGHDVTAFVRNAGKLKISGAQESLGDVRDFSSVKKAVTSDFDAIIFAVGEKELKPSDLVSVATANVVKAAQENGISRYLAVSGSAEIENQTWGGKLYTALLRKTPVGHAIKDHDEALRRVKASALDWTLFGCNYLADGPEKGEFKTSLTFEGGFKKIFPGDVASFMLRELTDGRYKKQVVGIWY